MQTAGIMTDYKWPGVKRSNAMVKVNGRKVAASGIKLKSMLFKAIVLGVILYIREGVSGYMGM